MIKKIYFTIALLLSATMMFAQESTGKLETRTFSIIGKDTLKFDTFYQSPSTTLPHPRPHPLRLRGQFTH